MTQTTEQTPIFSKRTGKLIGRVSENGVLWWNKISKEWELFTWEELQAKVEKNKQSLS